MSLLATYVEGLKEGNAEKVGSVFSENALFNDQAPKVMGMDAIVLNGRDAIQENFAGFFTNGGMNVENICINGSAMRYDIVLGEGLAIKALGVAKEENGTIVEYEVQAAP